MDEYVFVYGTLRKGYGNHEKFLNKPTVRFVGNATTKEKYAMFARGVPFVNKNYQQSNIKGEIYAVDSKTLMALDALEGHPRWYKREKIDCIIDDGQEIQAWIYFNNDCENGQLVESGDYADYRKKLLTY